MGKLRLTCIFLGLTAVLLWNWTALAEPLAHSVPDYEKENLEQLLVKDELTAEEYEQIFRQTGFGRAAVDALQKEEKAEILLEAQRIFFSEVNVKCRPNSPVSREEALINEADEPYSQVLLAPVEEGDILITPCSHVFGWRNGHAAIVVDAEKKKTLESVVLGQDSCVQSLDKWRYYPSFLILRLREGGREKRAAIAAYALEALNGVPYGFSPGLLTDKYEENGYRETNCSHLIWAAYRRFGYDIDSTGGGIVTPRDIAHSPLLEVIQVYGMAPDAF